MNTRESVEHFALVQAIDSFIDRLDKTATGAARESRRRTGERWIAALVEMTDGYGQSVAEALSPTFDPGDHYRSMVALTGAEFVSVCEHHLLPFSGTATIAYLPSEETCRVVGISKLVRVLHLFARRLQMQERLCGQIASAIEEQLGAAGVGVTLRASHDCMTCRGVRANRTSSLVTTTLLGKFLTDATVRSEFQSLG